MTPKDELAQMTRRFQAAEKGGDARVVLLARNGIQLLQDVLELSQKLDRAERELDEGVLELQRAWDATKQSDAGARLALAAAEKSRVDLEAALDTVARLTRELERAAKRFVEHGK